MNEEELIKKYVSEDKQSDAINKLKEGYPVQYLIGNVDFYDTNIVVNESVLIPRFETEYLVDKTIKILKEKFNKKISIADLGTGSGAIAIALKKNIDSEVTAFDISEEALKVAKENAKNNAVNITFIKHDIHNIIPGKYDCLISNPPYLPEGSEIAEPVKYEPDIALYGDNRGLEFYYAILNYAKQVLNKEFLIAFEIGNDQEQSLIEYASNILPNTKIWSDKDLEGRIRYIFITNE